MVVELLSDKKKINSIISYLNKNYNTPLDFFNNIYFYIDSKEKIYISEYKSLNIFPHLKIINLGIYFGKFQKERFRLSIEGCIIIKPKKNFLILKKEALSSFLYGEDLMLNDFENIDDVEENIFIPIVYQNDYIGTVWKTGTFYKNYISKGRKIQFNRVF